MRRWTPVLFVVAALGLMGVATNYFYSINVKTTLTTSDLVVTDGFEVPVAFKDGSTTVASVTAAGEIVGTTGVGAYDDVGAPTEIAAISLTGPLATPETGESPRLSLTNSTETLEMALETGGVSFDMPLGTDTTLTVENSGAGDGVVKADRFAVEFPGINSTTDRIYIDHTGLNFYIGQGGFVAPVNVPFNYQFTKGTNGVLTLKETLTSGNIRGFDFGTSSQDLPVRVYGNLELVTDTSTLLISEDSSKIKCASGIPVNYEAPDSITLDAYKSSSNSTVSVTNSSSGNANLSIDGFLVLSTSGSGTAITSGVTVPTQTRTKLDTEGGAASDDLDTITATGIPDGAMLMLRTSSSSRDVVVKHLTGNIRLNGAADFTLVNTSSTLTLIWDSALSVWKEISRSNN